MRGNAYLSRKVGSKEPFSYTRRVEVKEPKVFIGARNPGDHFAPAAKVFIKAEELYDNRKRRA